MVVEKLKGQVVTAIYNYFGCSMKCVAAVKNDTFARGVVPGSMHAGVEIVGRLLKRPESAVEKF
jgi:hypothetical protein